MQHCHGFWQSLASLIIHCGCELRPKTLGELGSLSSIWGHGSIFGYRLLSYLRESKSILLPRDGASACPSLESIRVELSVFDGVSQHCADLRQLQLEETDQGHGVSGIGCLHQEEV